MMNTNSGVRSGKRNGFTLVELLVVVVIIGILVALLLPATRSPRTSRRRTQCRNNLKQIGLALHNYQDVHKSFPPAYTVDADGNRLHSWRTLILPFIDQAPLYETIDLTKPWNDPVNAAAFETSLSAYQCSSLELASAQTTYLAIVGEENAFSPTRGREFKEMKDGSSNTAMVLDVSVDDAVHWMSPHDVAGDYLPGLNENSNLSHVLGIHMLRGDGSVSYIPIEAPKELRAALTTIAAGDESYMESDY